MRTRNNSLLGWGLLVLALAIGMACNPLELAQQAPALATQAVQVATQAVEAATQVSQTELAPTPAPKVTKPAATQPVQPTQPAATKSAGATATPAKPLAGKVGQRVTGGNFALTVTKAEFSKGTSDVQPDQGNVFLLVHVVVENISTTDNVFVRADAFQVKDSTGKLTGWIALSFLDDELGYAEYAPGGKVPATIGFQVSQKAKGFHLLFDYGGDKPMDFDLGL